MADRVQEPRAILTPYLGAKNVCYDQLLNVADCSYLIRDFI